MIILPGQTRDTHRQNLRQRAFCAGCHGFKWDSCAPAALLGGLGGQITDMNGGVLSYHSLAEQANPAGGVVASAADHWRFLGHAIEHSSAAVAAGADATGVRTATAQRKEEEAAEGLAGLRARLADAARTLTLTCNGSGTTGVAGNDSSGGGGGGGKVDSGGASAKL